MSKTLKNIETQRLIQKFVWGEEPKNLNSIIQELKNRNIDHTAIADEVSDIIIKYAHDATLRKPV